MKAEANSRRNHIVSAIVRASRYSVVFQYNISLSLAVLTASFSDDCTHGNETVLTSSKGYLAMFPRPPPISAEGDIDQATPVSCPWILGTEAGQRFNVTWRLASTTSFAAANSLYDGKCDTLGCFRFFFPRLHLYLLVRQRYAYVCCCTRPYTS